MDAEPQVDLSICIATRNRASFLEKTLEYLIPQITSGTEVLIVDGGSSDTIPLAVERFRRRCPSISYFRLEEAGGVDRHYALAVENALGNYCWLMSDDDILLPGGVQAILDQIGKGYSLILPNAEVRKT